jgi:hypothetical protein
LCRSDDRCWTHQLPPLSPDDIGPYIVHRLRLAGYKGPGIFTPLSILMIAEHSGGISREINMACSEALRVCMESDAMTVDEHCVQQTIARLRNSYKSEAPRDFLVSGAIPLHVEERRFPDPAIVIEEVERWSLRHEHSWSGTVGELLGELQVDADTCSGSDGERLTEFLLNTLEENASRLAANGLTLSISATEGCLRVITLRRTNAGAKSEDKAAEPRTGDGTHPSDNGHVEQSTLAHQESLHSSSPAQPTSASNPATLTAPVSEPTHEAENDTEIFRNVLLNSESAAGDRPRFPRVAKLLLAVVMLVALALFWSRRTFISQATGNRPQGKVASVGPVTGSDDPQSTLLGLLRSAEMGDPASQLALANLYQSGEVVQKDDAKAVDWLQKAASQGETEAAYRLGNAYKMGQGIPANKVDAYCWYVLAAEAGHGASERQIKELTSQLNDADIAAVRYRLGEMHLRGEGTKADPGAAYFWFQLAQVAGHPAAKQAKERLLSQMDHEQIAEASAKATKWLQTHPPRSATNTSQSQGVATSR